MDLIISGYLKLTKVIMQGKSFQRCTHLLYWSVLYLGGNVNTRRMSKPDMGSIGNYYVNYQNYQNLILLTFRILNKHWCIYSYLQIPPRENWFQYVRRGYATAINFPCISTLKLTMYFPFRLFRSSTKIQKNLIYYWIAISKKIILLNYVKRKLWKMMLNIYI